MSAKEMLGQAVESLAPDVTLEDAIGHLNLLCKVERGLQEVREGRTVSQEEAKERMKHWLQ